jgi:hypothetical protein
MPWPGSSVNQRDCFKKFVQTSILIGRQNSLADFLGSSCSLTHLSKLTIFPGQLFNSSGKSSANRRVTKVNEKGETRLHIAARHNKTCDAAELIQEGADVDAQDYAG